MWGINVRMNVEWVNVVTINLCEVLCCADVVFAFNYD